MIGLPRSRLHGCRNGLCLRKEIPADAPEHDDAIKLAISVVTECGRLRRGRGRVAGAAPPGDDDRNGDFSQTVDMFAALCHAKKVHARN